MNIATGRASASKRPTTWPATKPGPSSSTWPFIGSSSRSKGCGRTRLWPPWRPPARKKDTRPVAGGELAAGKTMRRGVDHRSCAIADLHDRQAAFSRAVGAETKYAVGPIEPRRIGQDAVREPVRPLGAGESGDKRNRIVGERGEPGRVAVELGAIAIGEGVEAGAFRRGEPRALQRGKAQHARVVPDASAEDLSFDAAGVERIVDRGHAIGLFRDEQRVDLVGDR